MWRRSSVRIAPMCKEMNVLSPVPTVGSGSEDFFKTLPAAAPRSPGAAAALKKVSALLPGRRRRMLDIPQLAVTGARLGWHVAVAASQCSWEVRAGSLGVLLVVVDGDLPAAAACIATLRAQPLDDCPIVALLADVSPAGAPDLQQVLELQCDLLACGADDVVHSVAAASALELLLSMSRSRCLAQRYSSQATPCRPSDASRDMSEKPSGWMSMPSSDCARDAPAAFHGKTSEADSLLISELSWGGSYGPRAACDGARRDADADFMLSIDGAWDRAAPRAVTLDALEQGAPAETLMPRTYAEIGVNTDAAFEGGSNFCCAKCSRPPVAPAPPRPAAPPAAGRGLRRKGSKVQAAAVVPEEFHGLWEVCRVDGSEVADLNDVNPWLQTLHIGSGGVVLGDGKMDLIKEGQDARLYLCGGELTLDGDRLVRVGKTGIAVEFCRTQTADGDEPVGRAATL